MRKSTSVFSLAALALLVMGCGGTKATGPISNFNVTWAERSRDLNAPTAAKSIRLVVRGGKKNGADFSFFANRPSTSEQTTVTYKIQNDWLLSPTYVYIEFYADYNGYGKLVAQGSAPIMPTDTGITIPNINFASTITRVYVPNQSVDPNKSKDLLYTCYNNTGDVIPVSFGSAVWLTSDESMLTFSHGKAVPHGNRGHVGVTAKVNDIPSLQASIPVNSSVFQMGIDTGQSVTIGSPIVLKYAAKDVYGSTLDIYPKEMTWTSLEPGILGIDVNGNAIAQSVGTAHVKCSYTNPDGTVITSPTVTVTVKSST